MEPVITAKIDQPDASGEIDPDRVIWRFRFEYCRTPTQSMPWWQSLTRAYQQPSCQYIGVDEGQRSWPLIDAEGSATTTVTKSTLPVPTAEDGVLPQTSSRGYDCPACSFHTSKVYRNLAPDMCLNETCPTWTKTAEWFRELHPPIYAPFEAHRTNKHVQDVPEPSGQNGSGLPISKPQ